MRRFFKKIHIKRGGIMIMCIMIASALIGCSSQTKDVSANEIGETIQKGVKMDEVEKGDQKKLQKLYEINAEDIVGFALYTASTNMKADELLILKVKNSKDIETMKKKVEDRINSQSQKFKDYLPNENFLVENHVLKIKGNYILLAISAQSDKIEKKFQEVLTK
ncbi:hypothetical protein COC69_15825 [Bacillus cereus]|uniref:DUF4358 domain-containing protein n=1 Tax=Bacillus cereus TaxID=1396 RepID=A0A9X7CME1_BACCE|nr:DUF4358 domain-containing protein [Bacillus cereus]PGS78312.1 hypothetical protein COC69_15825 [Bacillus cereus]